MKIHATFLVDYDQFSGCRGVSREFVVSVAMATRVLRRINPVDNCGRRLFKGHIYKVSPCSGSLVSEMSFKDNVDGSTPDAG